MWGRSSKQRRASERRRRKYLRAWDQKMKTLAFGWLYSGMPRLPPPPGVRDWLERRNRMMLSRTRRRPGALYSDYSAIEMRMLANMAQSLDYPIVVAVQGDFSPTGRDLRSDMQRTAFDHVYGRRR